MGILNHRLGILLGISTSRPNPWLVVYFIQGLSKERNKTESNKLFFIYVYYQSLYIGKGYSYFYSEIGAPFSRKAECS